MMCWRGAENCGVGEEQRIVMCWRGAENCGVGEEQRIVMTRANLMLERSRKFPLASYALCSLLWQLFI